MTITLVDQLQPMTITLVDQLRNGPWEERLVTLWDGIGDRNAVPGPASAEKAELDGRLAAHAANPAEVAPWHELVRTGLIEALVALICNLGWAVLQDRLDPFSSMGLAALAKAGV
jgi:hypothetical protein